MSSLVVPTMAFVMMRLAVLPIPISNLSVILRTLAQFLHTYSVLRNVICILYMKFLLCTQSSLVPSLLTRRVPLSIAAAQKREPGTLCTCMR